jgi:hypothetical protein
MKKIHIVTFDGCGTAKKLIADLENVQESENFDLEVTVVPSADKAEEMGLYGSPTIYIDGCEYQKNSGSSPGFY